MTTLEIIRTIAPELADIDDVKIGKFIELADSQVSSSMCQRNMAVAYLSCHLASLATRGGVGGSVTSEREGDLYRSFGTTDASSIGSTSYGLEYQRIIRNCCVLPRNRLV